MRRFAIVAILTAVCLMCATLQVVAEELQTGKDVKKNGQKPANYMELGKDMMKALKESPGCLGVEVAVTVSGKNVIFAWFKDKKACLAWYYSDAHRKMMTTFFPDQTFRKPLRDVPDDCGPIMAIASITFSAKPKFDGTTLPFSQISIELYAPLKGGLSAGGSFAPPALKVPSIKNGTPKK